MGRPSKKRKLETERSIDEENIAIKVLKDRSSKNGTEEDPINKTSRRTSRVRSKDSETSAQDAHKVSSLDVHVPTRAKRARRSNKLSAGSSPDDPPRKVRKSKKKDNAKEDISTVKREDLTEDDAMVDEDVTPSSSTTDAARDSSIKPRSRAVPALKKEKSDAAEVALRKISEQMNHVDSDSDSSTDAARNSGRSTGVKLEALSGSENDDDDDDEMFEDVDISTRQGASLKFNIDLDHSTDLELTLEKAERLQLAKTGKKKQSVRAVHERCFCHYMSAITMVAVGAWRNVWVNDVRLHKILRKHLKSRSPMLDSELASAAYTSSLPSIELVELMGRVMRKFGRLFKRTKPGLRKLGHRAVSQMDAGKDMEDSAEMFTDMEAVLSQAKSMKGSRDFGALLFTGLLRAYHFRVRLIFSTQPLGYKFNEREEFNAASTKQAQMSNSKATNQEECTTESALPTTALISGGVVRASSSSLIELDSDTETVSRRKSHNIKSEVKRNTRKRVRSGAEDDAISLGDSDLTDLNSDDLISDPDLLTDLEPEHPDLILPKVQPADEIDADLEYPIFWTEVFDAAKQQWIAIDAIVKKAVFVDEKGFKSMHPKGSKAEQQKLTLGFVVAYDANKYAKDVTIRYASSWAKVKEVFLRADGKSNTRYDVNKILVRMSNPYRDELERQEDDTLAFKEVKKPPPEEMPKNLADFKSSPKYILDKHLREKDAFRPDAKPIDSFSTGKGAKATTSKVYLRKDVFPCKTIENYHKEGLRIKEGERPRKMIKARAMTTNRIREHQQQLAETGEEHVMQGIYSLDQTEYIIPPPIKNGVIPKNAYGNADVFVESMIPQGATHLKLKGAARIARKMEIDHAKAVVGFEFKKRGAIPLVLGVLVADENAAALQAAWEEAEEIRIRKEDKKKTDAALKMWAKLLKGLRIRNRINAEYGILVDAEDEVLGSMTVPEAPVQKTLQEQIALNVHEEDSQEAGGFVRD